MSEEDFKCEHGVKVEMPFSEGPICGFGCEMHKDAYDLWTMVSIVNPLQDQIDARYGPPRAKGDTDAS